MFASSNLVSHLLLSLSIADEDWYSLAKKALIEVISIKVGSFSICVTGAGNSMLPVGP